MAYLNKVFLVGNLTRDPEERFVPSGTAVCEFRIAVNRKFVTSNGEDKEETLFTDVVVWGKQAESCARFLHKGSPVLIEGRLQTDQWQDKETGQNRSKLRVVAERVQFLTKQQHESDNNAFSSQGGYSGSSHNYQNRNQGETQNTGQSYSHQQSSLPDSQPVSNEVNIDKSFETENDFDDNIPF